MAIGIGDLFAGRFFGNEVCLKTNTGVYKCVDGDELNNLMNGNGGTTVVPSGNSNTGGSTGDTGNGTSTEPGTGGNGTTTDSGTGGTGTGTSTDPGTPADSGAPADSGTPADSGAPADSGTPATGDTGSTETPTP
jgi:hypothetical protein